MVALYSRMGIATMLRCQLPREAALLDEVFSCAVIQIHGSQPDPILARAWQDASLHGRVSAPSWLSKQRLFTGVPRHGRGMVPDMPACSAGLKGKGAEAGQEAEPAENGAGKDGQDLEEAARKRAGDVEFENQMAMAMQVRRLSCCPHAALLHLEQACLWPVLGPGCALDPRSWGV